MIEDETKIKFAHSAAHHTTYVQGVTLLPFDVYDCEAFFDYLATSGLSFAAKFPTKPELLKAQTRSRQPRPQFKYHSTLPRRYLDQDPLSFLRHHILTNLKSPIYPPSFHLQVCGSRFRHIPQESR
jgi:hypothetical protein